MSGLPEVSSTAFRLEPRPGEILRGDVWRPASGADPANRAIAVCHGFKGFKDWGFFPYAGRSLAGALACPVVTFNFTGSGVGEDLESFTEAEAFAHNTFGKELDDLGALLDGLRAGRLGLASVSPVRRIGVLGHSRGGAAAILASERPAVRAVVTWAAIAGVERYLSMFENSDPDQPVQVRNARTGDVLPLHRDVVEEVLADPSRFDLEAALRRSGVPLLAIHGTEDESVPPADARRLAAASPTARLELIEAAGHTFGVGHPFEKPSRELERAIRLTIDHFESHL